MSKLTAEHRQLIVIWGQLGHKPAAILRKLTDCGVKVTRGHVSTILSLERQAGVEIPRATEAGGKKRIRSDVKRDTVAFLEPHAERRGITVQALAGLLLDAVAEGKIVDAVLDDADAIEVAK